MNRYSAIILAGGKSTRYGANKALAEIGGKILIERVLDALDGLFDEIIISANDPALYKKYGGKVVGDMYNSGGALVGLYSALYSIKNEYAFATACDMPFLSRDFIEYMMSIPREYDVLAPQCKGFTEPLHAIYSKRCLDAMKAHIERGEKKVSCFYKDVNVKYIDEAATKKFDPDGSMFLNVNSADDMKKAKSISEKNPNK